MSFPRYPAYKPSGVEWLGEVPEHWEEKPLKTVTSINDEVLSESVSTDHEIEYVDISSVSLTNGIERTESMIFGDAPSRARRIPRDGDVLVATVRTYLKAIAPVVSPPSNLVASTGFAVVRPQCGIHPGYLKYALQEEHFIQQVISRSTGVSYPAINASDIARISLSLPKQSEQRAIATFLDRETAKIDALIAEQQRLIELLQEKRQAVISHAVTKGLNPDAPMKDSGVEWLGEVPEHWTITRLGRITLARCDGPFGSGLKSEHYVDSGVLVVRLQNIKSTGYDSTVSAFIDLQYYSERLGDHDVEPGDLLIAGLGDDNNHVGRACVAPYDLGAAMVKADCFRFRLAAEVAIPEFIASSLNTSAPFHGGTLSSGSTRSRIPLSMMASREVALPPLEEQMEILSEIKSKLSAVDQLKREGEEAIGLLQERRSALISAAVTGQIDVRGLVPDSGAA